MQMQIRENGNAALVAVSGKLTAIHLSASLRGAVKQLLAKGIKRIVIDMGELIHIDSTGVGELVSAYTSATAEQAELELYDVPESCMELLEITNLSDIFKVRKKGDVAVVSVFP